MMRVTIDINERYAHILSITAIRCSESENALSLSAVNLENGKYICIDRYGRLSQANEPPKELADGEV